MSCSQPIRLTFLVAALSVLWVSRSTAQGPDPAGVMHEQPSKQKSEQFFPLTMEKLEKIGLTYITAEQLPYFDKFFPGRLDLGKRFEIPEDELASTSSHLILRKFFFSPAPVTFFTWNDPNIPITLAILGSWDGKSSVRVHPRGCIPALPGCIQEIGRMGRTHAEVSGQPP